jgi:hypothetical protein
MECDAHGDSSPCTNSHLTIGRGQQKSPATDAAGRSRFSIYLAWQQ